ncbi:lysosomal acid lipase/cholesteryl ester hydrolase-like [Oppia nitens]|uniref:lysosomal acid lipase/cholesteryl ester hydrolase-like n=1 Tax=Oppia nitens TaxID=1686743 RepID=UPI0023DB0398|nr:lysosomal acid lipase/cholesteryl ester hydrolase-like [Oppia nitens]
MNYTYFEQLLKLNCGKIIKFISVAIILVAIYWAPVADYMIDGLKYLPGYYHHLDTVRNTVEVIESRGFKCQTHYVESGDGYIIAVHRVVNPYVKDRDRTQLKPVLLQHGFQSSSKGWVITSDGQLDPSDGIYREPGVTDADGGDGDGQQVANTLPFLLATRGYDVWLSNMRGNVYALNHTVLSSDDTEFWKFSIDEMIEYDLTAIISHILKSTEKKTLGYIGHSKGTIMMFGLLASKLEYNQLVKPFIALSPVSFLGHSTTPLLFMTHFEPLYRSYPTSLLHLGKLQQFYAQLCENWYMQRVCHKIFYLIFGFGEQHFDYSRIGPYLSTVPNGAGTWSGTHLLQKFITKRPTKFNFGEPGNRVRYGQPVPPEYNLSSITSPNIALIYAASDWLNDPKDIAILKQTLKVKLLDDYLVPDPTWNHMELMWARDVGKLVNKKILELLDKY